MFVPRAVKRSGPISTKRNKKSKTTISTYEVPLATSSLSISKDTTVEKLDLVQEQPTLIENLELGKHDKITKIDLKPVENTSQDKKAGIDLVAGNVELDEQNKPTVNLLNNEQTQLIAQQVVSEIDRHMNDNSENSESSIVEQLKVENQIKQIPEVNVQGSDLQQVQDDVEQEEPVKGV